MSADNDLRDALIAAIRSRIDEATKSGICYNFAVVAVDAAIEVLGNWTAIEPDDSKAINA